jgi:hypothetical protein
MLHRMWRINRSISKTVVCDELAGRVLRSPAATKAAAGTRCLGNSERSTRETGWDLAHLQGPKT